MRTTALTCGLICALPLALAAPAAAADTYEIDATHSMVVFRIKHLGVSWFYGRFNDVKGSFSIDADDPGKSKVEVEVGVDSVDTANQKRDQHLKSPDFFNAKQFPKITFKSKSVKKVDEDTYELTGDLSLHGVTKEITVRADHVGLGPDPWGGFRSGYELVFSIKRSDYDMKYMLGGLSDEVRLMIAIEGVKKG